LTSNIGCIGTGLEVSVRLFSNEEEEIEYLKSIIRCYRGKSLAIICKIIGIRQYFSNLNLIFSFIIIIFGGGVNLFLIAIKKALII
jgi:hypothetical protein